MNWGFVLLLFLVTRMERSNSTVTGEQDKTAPSEFENSKKKNHEREDENPKMLGANSLRSAKAEPGSKSKLKVNLDKLKKGEAIHKYTINRKALQYKYDKSNLSETAIKLKEARDEMAQKKKFQSGRFIRLLANFELRPSDFEILNTISDKNESRQVRLLKQLIEDSSLHVFVNKDPKLKSLIKATRKKIASDIKKQISEYFQWRKQSWLRIQSVWTQKAIYYYRDDALNREEHEKLYQLFLIEDAEKLKFLLPIVEVQRKIMEVIDRRLNDMDNEKYILLAIKLMTKQLFIEYLKRFQKYHSQHNKDYTSDITQMDNQFMADYQENVNFQKAMNPISE
jgi:hypothetical protein